MSEWKKSGSLSRFRIEKSKPRQVDAAATSSNPPARALAIHSLFHDSLPDSRNTDVDFEYTSTGESRNLGGRTFLNCNRCKRLKRKCDRTLPECLVCSKAGASCQFPNISNVMTLGFRISWLSNFIDSVLPDDITVDSLKTGTDLHGIFRENLSKADSDYSLMLSPSQSSRTGNSLEDNTWSSPQSLGTGDNSRSKPQFPPLPELPSDISFMDLVQAYFDHEHLSNPFLNEKETLIEAESLLNSSDWQNIEINATWTKYYLIMALGCERLHRLGRIPYSTFAKFEIPFHEVVRLCLADTSLASIQLLFLLALYSLHDPRSWPPWTITSLLGRQAIYLGLNQKTKPDSGLSLEEVEARRRTFWCIFSVDRLVSATFGLPLAIDKNDINVPFPGVTIEEFTARQQIDYSKTLQITRQDITLSELLGKVFYRIHLERFKYTSQLHHRDRQYIIEKLRTKADNWYTQGCLLTRMDTSEVPSHNTIPWLNTYYYWILAVLYCPSRLNTNLSPSELLELQDAARKYIQGAYVQLQYAHLTLHHSTLNRFLVICRIILHCYSWCSTTDIVIHEEVIFKAIKILSRFAPIWTFAQRCCLIFQRLALLIRKSFQGPVSEDLTAVLDVDAAAWQNDTLGLIMDESELLIYQALGASSVYNHFADEPRPDN